MSYLQKMLEGLPLFAPRPKRELCAPCRAGQHVDHHRGIWARADGSDAVVCPCSRCEVRR